MKIQDTFEITLENVGKCVVGRRFRKIIVQVQCIQDPKFYDWFTQHVILSLTSEGLIEVKV